MRDDLLNYYERELTFLRQLGAEFADKYPKIASRLLLEPDKCEDPYVERMVEAFAFLAARVHLKIDDEYPQITESFFDILYPHYLAPIPSMSIVQFTLDPEAQLTTGYTIERGTVIYSRPVGGMMCRFRTSYPVTLWPMEITGASLESPDKLLRHPAGGCDAMVRIKLRGLNGLPLSEMKTEAKEKAAPLNRLRFYLNAERHIAHPLYEMILNRTLQVELRALSSRKPGVRSVKPIILPPSCLHPVGFGADEGMLPFAPSSFMGYRLLTEYFAFPDKFLFFDITQIDRAVRAGFGDQWEIAIYLKESRDANVPVDITTFQLGCTPIVNLFPKEAEPIQLSHQRHEYHVIPDVHRPMAIEVYSVDSVTSVDPTSQQVRKFRPFYSYHHGHTQESERIYWYKSRRASQRKNDSGTEVYISLVDLGFNPDTPAVETLIIHLTCTNRDLPEKLPFGGRGGDFDMEGSRGLFRLRCLRKPTNTLRPPLRKASHWRLLSHLSLNHLSIVGSGENNLPDALREILLLYDFTDSAATRKQIQGIQKISSRRVVRQVGSALEAALARGLETTLELDEDQFVGSGVFLFASVLERFLGLYASINTFNQLIVKTRQREGILKKWPPRAGSQIIL